MRLRVLLVSKYLRHVGGVETYVASLRDLLVKQGHAVGFMGMDLPRESSQLYQADDEVWFTPDREFAGESRLRVISSAARSVYSPAVARVLERSVREFRPDVIHFHGTCYQLTPSVFKVVRNLGVGAVITAHEYKLACANQRFWDDAAGRECFACSGLNSPQKVRQILSHRCIKNSLGASVLGAIEQPISEFHVDRSNMLIHAPSRFMREQLVADGYAPTRVRYADLPWSTARRAPIRGKRRKVVYLGRLAAEKGVANLLGAWRYVEDMSDELELKICGSGSELTRLVERSQSIGLKRVEFAGRYSIHELESILADALATVHPSLWAENSPYTVRESLLHGVPAIVSNRGGLPEMVGTRSGSVFQAANDEELADLILGESSSPRAGSNDLTEEVAARSVTPDAHVDFLEHLYREAMADARTRPA